MGSFDTPPDLVEELRGMKSRLAELERASLGIVRAAGFMDPAVADVGATTTVGSSATGTISWTDVDTNVGGIFNPASPTIFTAPRDGIYVLHGSAAFNVNATGDRQVSFSGYGGMVVPTVASGQSQLKIGTLASLFEGETISLTVWQNSGATLGVVCRFSMAWLGVAA